MRLTILILGAALLAGCGQPAAPGENAAAPATAAAPAPAASVGPPVLWAAVPDTFCIWETTRGGQRAGHSFAASGDEPDPVLHFDDPQFRAIPMEDRPIVTLRADGDARRTVELEGWSSHGGESGSLGMYLDAEARGKLGGARRLELIREGRTLLDLPMQGFPSRAAMDQCVQPGAAHSDAE